MEKNQDDEEAEGVSYPSQLNPLLRSIRWRSQFAMGPGGRVCIEGHLMSRCFDILASHSLRGNEILAQHR